MMGMFTTHKVAFLLAGLCVTFLVNLLLWMSYRIYDNYKRVSDLARLLNAL